jgi:cobalt/nickel transport protein
MTRVFLCLLLFASAAVPALGHFALLLPGRWAAERDKELTLTYMWGHPFEHELSDAPRPEAAWVRSPDGKVADLSTALAKVKVPGGAGKDVLAYRLRFTPRQRGDHVFGLSLPPHWSEATQEFWEDSVRVVVHVATQKGWDGATDKGFELVPLTRPYGLRPGTVFQVQARADGKPLAGVEVELEHYHPAPPKELPPDEQITGRVKTDPVGVATCTLDEPGWWCVTAQRQAGRRERGGSLYPVRQRATFWVWVDESRRGR